MKLEKIYKHKEYKKLKHQFNKQNIIIEISIASLILVLLVFCLSQINLDIRKGLGESVLVFASFASSVYILFLMPYSKAAKISRFAKSYAIAGIVGYLGLIASSYVNFYLIVFLVMFFVSLMMFETDSEHPPALGIALAFMLYKISFPGLLVLICGIILLSLAKMIMLKLGLLSNYKVV